MSFDRLAPHYRWMEWFLAGDILQAARTCWLSKVAATRRALLLGEGNGRFLVPALRAMPEATLHCVDASEVMLRQAGRVVPASERERVTFEVASLPGWRRSGESYDLVVTNFFLDCFPADELEQVMAVAAEASALNSAWMLADFAVPRSGWKRTRAKVIHGSMYAFFRWATGIRACRLIAPEPLLPALGFERVAAREFEWGLVRSSLWWRGETPRSWEAPSSF